MRAAVFMMVMALGLVGCGERDPDPINVPVAGPPAADVDRALATSWDYIMEAASRPQITWFDNSRCAMTRVVANATMQPAAPRCDDMSFNSEGSLSVGWHPGQRISDTGLGLGLAQWQEWMWTSSLAATDRINVSRVRFDAAIAAAGL